MPGRSKAKLVPYSARRKHDPRRAASGPEKQIHAMLREKGIAFTREKLIGSCHVLNGDSAERTHGSRRSQDRWAKQLVACWQPRSEPSSVACPGTQVPADAYRQAANP
jgi:hypothetical protein